MAQKCGKLLLSVLVYDIVSSFGPLVGVAFLRARNTRFCSLDIGTECESTGIQVPESTDFADSTQMSSLRGRAWFVLCSGVCRLSRLNRVVMIQNQTDAADELPNRPRARHYAHQPRFCCRRSDERLDRTQAGYHDGKSRLHGRLTAAGAR